jgi:hypothetical protein
MVVWLETETWVVVIRGTKRIGGKGGLACVGAAGFCGPYVFGCICVVVVEGACVRVAGGWGYMV